MANNETSSTGLTGFEGQSQEALKEVIRTPDQNLSAGERMRETLQAGAELRKAQDKALGS